ncbi:MAG TPA: glycoside hydrolase family 172 protein [Bacteroidales bacterium]|nr:glycoside hydrolase family 172 protein [Bacteroidales bacterium]
MKKLMSGSAAMFLLAMLVICGCETGNRADIESILNPGMLPYLKASKLIQVSSSDTTGGNEDYIRVLPGKTATIFNVSGPGIITRIWFTIDSRDPYFLRRVVIRMFWDREKSPSVEVPFGDFFGTGFAYKQYATPYLSMSSGGYTCFFPMPFEESARIDIVNETGKEIPALYYQVDYQKLDGYIPRDVAYFHAFWRRDVRTDYDSNYTILDIKGRGHVVGLNLNVQSYRKNFAFLEGDEKIFVDGETKPSIQGTGTEDYFSSGWYFNKGEYAGPYNGLILKDTSLGRIAAYRFHILDPIPFKKSIRFSIEHGHGNQEIADYSSTVYWYQIEPHQPFPPLPKAGLRIPLRTVVPNGILEAEKLSFNLGRIPSVKEDMSDWGAEWGGLKQLRVETEKNDSFSLVLNNMSESQYDIRIYFTRGPDYGNTAVYYQNKKIGEIAGFNPSIIPAGPLVLPPLQNQASSIRLSFRVTGKDTLSKGYATGLDALEVIPKRSYIPDWYIIGPFPNPLGSGGARLGIDSAFDPEVSVDLTAPAEGFNRKLVTWKYVKTPENGYFDLTRYFRPYEMAVGYAVTYLFSESDQEIPLWVGSDDGIKVFFNNRMVYRFLGVRIAEPDQKEILLEVKPGWNKLMLKVENNLGGFAFYARLIDKNKSLVVSAEQKRQIYRKK